MNLEIDGGADGSGLIAGSVTATEGLPLPEPPAGGVDVEPGFKTELIQAISELGDVPA
ncbi:MAG: hypothetical protein ACLP22_20535 [Solirubrobacteraceae bacterium]